MPTTVTMIRREDGSLIGSVLDNSPNVEYVEFLPLYRLLWTTPDYQR